MSFVNALQKEANYTETLNGAKTHRSAGDACLDMFSTAGALRYNTVNEQIRRFDRAYIENPELAMKLLFHIRDIRGGMGERELFRTLIRHTAKTWPRSAKKNVQYIAEFGRWDDLMCLMGTKAEREVVAVIRAQLDKDLEALKAREAGNKDAQISLLAKWLPSSNTSSARTRGQARVLIRALGMAERDYRRILKDLRANSCVTERYLTRNRVDKIDYEAVPAGAMLKYREAFRRHDGKRFDAYIEAASCGDAKIHTETLFPYEILRPFFQGGWYSNSDAKGQKTLEALWDNQPVDIASQNTVSVIDTSGSMYCCSGRPALISQALGMYFAERCKGPFHNKFITFSDYPEVVSIRGFTLADKLRYIQGAHWGYSTNMEAVFDLILRTAINSNASQEELPEVLYIISDMEFNAAVRDPDKTVYENAREKFERYGYKLPAVVFHNVNSWQMQAPVTAHTRGAALASGAGTTNLQHKFDGNTTPMSHMLRVLESERYAMIHA